MRERIKESDRIKERVREGIKERVRERIKGVKAETRKRFGISFIL